MTTDSTSVPPATDVSDLLTQTAIAYRAKLDGRAADSLPPSRTLVEALLQAEKQAKQQRQTLPIEPLLGHWRLCFTTARKVNLRQGRASHGSGFYVPQFTQAQISFTSPADATHSDHLAIGNQIEVVTLRLAVSGQARYLCQKNLLAFDFMQMQVSLLGKTLYQGRFPSRKSPHVEFAEQPLSTLPFFTFFWVTDEGVAARGRGGGLALWVRA